MHRDRHCRYLILPTSPIPLAGTGMRWSARASLSSFLTWWGELENWIPAKCRGAAAAAFAASTTAAYRVRGRRITLLSDILVSTNDFGRVTLSPAMPQGHRILDVPDMCVHGVVPMRVDQY